MYAASFLKMSARVALFFHTFSPSPPFSPTPRSLLPLLPLLPIPSFLPYSPFPTPHLCTARRQKGSKITRELSTSCAYVGFRNNSCNFCNPTMGQNTKTTTAQRKSNSRVMVVVRSDPNLPFQEKVEIKPGTIAGTTSKNQTQIYRSGKEPEKQAKPAGCSLSKPRPASTKCYLSPACR